MISSTPNGVARHLLTMLSREVLKLGDEPRPPLHPEFQRTLVLGVSQMLGQLLAAQTANSDERQSLLEAAISEIVRQLPWASVAVKAADDEHDG